MRQAVCVQCGAANRIAADKDAHKAKCGRCGAAIFQGRPLEVDDDGLRRHLLETKGAVLVDVWAPWCGPCRTMAPHFVEAAARLEPSVRLLKINADESAEAGRLGVRSIPTLILYMNGKEVGRRSGAMSTAQLVAWARGALQIAWRNGAIDDAFGYTS